MMIRDFYFGHLTVLCKLQSSLLIIINTANFIIS